MFKKRQSRPARASEYPAGIFLQTEKGYFYVFNKTQRYRFITKRVLDSWSPSTVVMASEQDAAVKKLTIFAKMKFRNGSLLYSQPNGRMYLVSDNKLRHITSPDWLKWLGLSHGDAVWVSEEEIQLHEMGLTLN